MRNAGETKYEYPQWVQDEHGLYNDVICGAVERVLGGGGGVLGCDVRYQSSDFTTSVWKESLECAIILISSRKMSICL